MKRQDLEELVAAGRRFRYLFFWSHRPEVAGVVDASCFSQWYEPAAFELDGERYLTTEHYMMAEKARLFGDEASRGRILAAEAPAEVKAIGRQVKGFDEATWAGARFEIVVRGNIAKFGQNAELKAFLLGTGESVIVEASPNDRIWGIGLEASDPRASVPSRWRGLNLLGFAMMAARERLVLS